MPAIRVLFSLTLLRSDMDVLAASFVLLMDARILAAPEPRARGGDRDVLVVGEPTADLPITDSAAAAMVSRAPVNSRGAYQSIGLDLILIDLANYVEI
jgi:hypothetical protein